MCNDRGYGFYKVNGGTSLKKGAVEFISSGPGDKLFIGEK